jgi:FG-GAP-like repeat/FG-GAP repeat
VAVAAGDLTGDGHLDLVVACDSGVVSVLLGDGRGGFADRATFPAGDRPRSVALGDFTGDGHLDAAVGVSNFRVAVLFGDGAGGFGPAAHFSVGPGRPDVVNQSTVVVGDFNRDGHLDLACAGQGTSAVSILLGDGTGQFAAPRLFPQFNAPKAIAAADFNGDGHLDLAVTNNGPGMTVLRGDVRANFTFSAAIRLSAATAVAAGDFNLDGHLDLAAIASSGLHGEAGTVAVALGDGRGQFGAPTFYAVGPRDYSTALPEPTQLGVADFDGDVRLDLAVPSRATDEVAILPALGEGSFGVAEAFPAGGSGPVGIAVGDFNEDGRPDLAVANYGSGTVGILANALPGA